MRSRRACVRGEEYGKYRDEVLEIIQEMHTAQLVSHAFSRCLEQHCRRKMGVPAFDSAEWCVCCVVRADLRPCCPCCMQCRLRGPELNACTAPCPHAGSLPRPTALCRGARADRLCRDAFEKASDEMDLSA